MTTFLLVFYDSFSMTISQRSGCLATFRIGGTHHKVVEYGTVVMCLEDNTLEEFDEDCRFPLP